MSPGDARSVQCTSQLTWPHRQLVPPIPFDDDTGGHSMEQPCRALKRISGPVHRRTRCCRNPQPRSVGQMHTCLKYGSFARSHLSPSPPVVVLSQVLLPQGCVGVTYATANNAPSRIQQRAYQRATRSCGHGVGLSAMSSHVMVPWLYSGVHSPLHAFTTDRRESLFQLLALSVRAQQQNSKITLPWAWLVFLLEDGA